MNTKTIDTAIYAVSPENIVKHRYNPLLGILLTIASAVMLWANGSVEWFDVHEVAAQWNLLVSSCMLCTGVTMVCYTLFGDSVAPHDRATRKRMYRTEYVFDANDYNRVKTAFEKGDFVQLRDLPRGYNPTVHVVCYATECGSLAAAQLLHQQEPQGDVRIFRRGEFAI